MPAKKTRSSGISRRGFIRTSLSAAAGLGITSKESLFGGSGQEAPAEKPRIREYRTLGRTGFKVSDIGFGAANLTDAPLLEAALDAGMNYIDTAEHYAHGNAERTIGQVLKNRDRKKIFITSKIFFPLGKSTKEGLKERAYRILERLQTDYVDCLMVHLASTLEMVKHKGYHEAIRELKAEGKVRFTGLSNHGAAHRDMGVTKNPMDQIILAAADDGRFDVVLFAYNFIQKEKGERILKACREKNMGATLMKTDPVRTYTDINNMYERMRKIGRITDAAEKIISLYRSYAEKSGEFAKKYGLSGDEGVRAASIKFCLSNPDVDSVCLGINTYDSLHTYVSLSGTRLGQIEEGMLDDYEALHGSLYCRHACGECEPLCPHGVPVNTIMRYQHYFMSHGREKYAMEKYADLQRMNAAVCTDCEGHCQATCPFGVQAQGLLMAAHQTLSLDYA